VTISGLNQKPKMEKNEKKGNNRNNYAQHHHMVTLAAFILI
jgi:hypothetical protein